MPSQIEFVDLKRQYATIKPEIDAAISAVVNAGAFIGGKAVTDFEQEFAAYCQTAYAVGVANGTDALQLALKAMGIGPGDEVITVSHTFIATVSAIIMVGATPVFAPIDPATYCLEPATLENYITPRTRAIIPVHIYGQPADMDPIMEVARQYNLFVLEDACQAHGAIYKGHRTGSLGHAAAFSFYPGKNLGAYGDGGAVTTNDEALAARIRRLADHGRTGKYEHSIFGYNSRLDAIQAAILGVKLRHLDSWNARRREIAARYTTLLAGTPGIVTPVEAGFARSVYHLYVIRTLQREAVQVALNTAGIGNGIHYPVPVHLQPAWTEKFGPTSDEKALGLIEQYAGQLMSLPMHPDMTDPEVELVAGLVGQALIRPTLAGSR